MSDSAEVLWNLYQEHSTWERHHEEQRSSVTNILVAVAAGILSVVTLNGFTPSDVPLMIFLVLQGVFGAVFVAKQYERFSRHQRLAKIYRQALSDRFPDAQVIALREMADEQQAKAHPMLYQLRLHHLWVALHLLIALFGLGLMGAVLL